MSLKIKTKLRYGIGLLFAMIVLLGGLSVKNISDMSADTRNILADNYNSLLYSRRMLDALERIDSDPSAQADFEKNLGLQKKNITEVDENVATSHLVAQYEQLAKERNEENIRRVRLALNQVNPFCVEQQSVVLIRISIHLAVSHTGKTACTSEPFPESPDPAE